MDIDPLIKLRPHSDSLFVSRGRSILVTGLDGFVRPDSKQGLFIHETRMLSRHGYYINNEPFYPVALSNIEQHSWLGYYIELPPEMKHGSMGGSGEVPKKSQHSVELIVHRRVGEGLHEDFFVTNFNQVSTSFVLKMEADGDFADLQELPDQRKQHGELQREWRKSDTNSWELRFDYKAEHHYSHQGDTGVAHFHRGMAVRVLESGSQPHNSGADIYFNIKLEPRETWRACIEFAPVLENARAAVEVAPCPMADQDSEYEIRREKFLETTTIAEIPGQQTLGPTVIATVERAKHDLADLRFYDLDSHGGWTVAAGLPLYVALFGRDTLIAAWQAAMLSPEILRGTLNELSSSQATEVNLWRDQLPGTMLHEAHTGPLSMLNYTPRANYHGTLTTPVFYSIALAEFWRWAGDSAVVKSLVESALRGIYWMEQYARSPVHGFYQYKTSSEQGVKNQAWKDSGDAIVYADGSQVEPPIAVSEAQGYFYAATMQLAQVLWEAGRSDQAKSMRNSALEFKKRFNDVFWMEHENIFALGVDAEGQQIGSVASNAGHCLGTGIAGPEQGIRVADRLFQEDMFSGWGVRTLSAQHPAYNPYSYHRGSVWPVEQGSFALGLWRYGQYEHMQRLCRAQFQLAGFFDHLRLPEVFSGHQRSRLYPFPALYPESNSPQAWSASAVFAMLSSMLGLFPFAAFGVLLVDPHLPAWLPEITLSNLQVGPAVVSMRFFRTMNGDSNYQVLDLKGELRVASRTNPWRLLDLMGDELHEQLASI
ncbi:MAG TPA: glycogen debranching N-terminal domain-containing protein [Candidatus Binataceae bacterium]|nr:glycogen debranching N-terminal domain-containing protein [Candidatus Binataceae bacterium]